MRLLKSSNQYLNLVTSGMRGHMYSLRRMDASRLFYPSTAEAEAAAAAEEAGASLEPGPMGAEALGRLRLRQANLEPGIHFQPPRTADDSFDPGRGDVFARFGGGSRVLCADAAGHAAVHDADARSFAGMPAMSPRKNRVYDVAVSVPRAGAGAGAHGWDDWIVDDDDDYSDTRGGLRAHSLYVLDMLGVRNEDGGDKRFSFEVLAYDGDRGGWRWDPLPPPPFLSGPKHLDAVGPGRRPYALVGGGGGTICVSTTTGTYAFDTVSSDSEWSKCGDWVLPFSGKAEYVPELGLWFAMARTSYSHSGLYALDLSAAAAGQPPPALCDVGFDLELRNDLFLFDHAVASLGAGKLCVARFFLIMKREHKYDNPIGVFTGVEAVRGDDGRVRVITHKSERFDEEFFRCLLL